MKDHYERETARFGMWVFLAMETLFFSGVFMVYFAERSKYPEAFGYGSDHLNLWLGTLNTAILLTSSWAVATAMYASQRQKAYLASRLMWVAALLGALFLLVKGFEFREDYIHGLLPILNFTPPASAPPGLALFMNLYLFTVSLHALHLMGGIGWLSVLAWKVRRHAPAITRWRSRIDVAALYWHFIDLVWIFIFPLYYLAERHR